MTSIALKPVSVTYTREEIARHATEGDAWIAISGKVYNLSTFNHPCGFGVISRYVGQDATLKFTAEHNAAQLKDLDDHFFIGYVALNAKFGG
jgi:cytochrome b involved in lipid metabolism